MMGMKVIGVQHVEGEFQGKHYDNYNLHCVSDVTPFMLGGEGCEIVKVKSSEIAGLTGGAVCSVADVCSLIGMFIMPYYDRSKRVIRLDILDQKGGD